MCGRFVLNATPEEVADYLDLIGLEDFPARFNIAPTQPILIVLEGARPEPGSNLPNRQAMLVRWGFMPGWVKDPKDFPLLINARSETAIDKASFRAAMRHRRILIPATGFYEWRRPPKEEGGKVQAYYIKPKKGGIVAFAGLMETWSSADGSEVDTGAILTTSANRSIARIHDRMPVVISPEDFSRWLDCKTQEPRDIIDLMKAADEDFFEMIPISDKVNKVANTGADVLDAVEEALAPAPKAGCRDDAQMSLF
ncbi:SOS response-associated peptidase [Agrobacterium rubi]|uniref:SOS response-associated peptidase n=1 Tax=Agrobacterium rubi TaxID=28099 RepID=UPI001571B15B|nr:SOS response-associated peptidase [Agrobacterium rubi]NTF07008.1 SOS response-associated peptidase [Agrobacterium rubi]NTF19249.1 SOS response-associated peptidase [Agrobacterium rubi]NTF26212.1 SOS response-associated peptidase [Agrobacterium rubi]